MEVLWESYGSLRKTAWKASISNFHNEPHRSHYSRLARPIPEEILDVGKKLYHYCMGLRENFGSYDARSDYVRWLEQFWWRWIGVLTFRPGIRMRAARHLLLRWIADLEGSEGHPVSWIAFMEKGAENESLHYHLLLAGIGSRLRLYIPKWEKAAGYAKLCVFRSSLLRQTPLGLEQSSGIAYAVKSLTQEDYSYELDLHDLHRLPRFRGHKDWQ